MSTAMNNILLQPQNATSSHEVKQEDSFSPPCLFFNHVLEINFNLYSQ